MAVDLADLVESLQREVSPPGNNLFPAATEDDLLGHLQDAFWEARLDGLLTEWVETDGEVSPIAVSGREIPRELQQLIVFYAGFRIVRNHLRGLTTSSSNRYKAGPVAYETETQQSATVFRDLLAELRQKRDMLLTNLTALGVIPSIVMDGIVNRTWYYGNGLDN